MAAHAHTPPVPLELYLASSWEPDAEFVDGAIEERPKGENQHSMWQHALELWFGCRAREWGVRVRPELRVQVTRGNFRVPDVALLDRSLPEESVATHPPVAVVEVLSPDDSHARIMTKLREYERMGIQTILVIDPEGEHMRFVAGRLEPLPAEPFTLPGSSARFDLDEIKKLLD